MAKVGFLGLGLMGYPMGGTVEGVAGDHVLLAPPFIVDEPLIDVIVERRGDAIDVATAQSSGLRTAPPS